MKESRSASQILFGYLPEQTADLQGGVWKVSRWRQPLRQMDIDASTLRRELCRQAMEWRTAGNDGGFVTDLERGRSIHVYTLDRKNGVEVEPFPKVWMCKSCGRLTGDPKKSCKCGHKGWPGQLPFVGYHDACGVIKSPSIPRCRQHDDVKIVFPGTTSAQEILFLCPVCNVQLRKGLGFYKCDCGQGNIVFNVHRAASVYTPRSVVIVNPPSLEKIKTIVDAGGPPRALSWVVDGMTTKTLGDVALTRDVLRRQLLGSGLPETTIAQMLLAAEASGSLAPAEREVILPPGHAEPAEAEAVTIALAMSESRQRVTDMVESTIPHSTLGVLYRDQYPVVMDAAGIHSVEFVDKFPVLTGHYGYTRGSPIPGASRLRAFSERSGAYAIYADIAQTEALFVRLDPVRIADWLRARGFALDSYSDQRTARISILRSANIPNAGAQPDDNIGSTLLTLIHSYTHRFIRLAAVHAGIEQSSLSELLVPLHLGFFVYAGARGDFVLGGLQAVFESSLDTLLRDLLHQEHRCPLDPGCKRTGGACMACLHLGEPSCRYYNRFLSRRTLFGQDGFLS